MSDDKRYPKRSAVVLKKEMVCSELMRIFLQLESVYELPSDLHGRHIKLFPFRDEYKKSYTISSHNEDVISLDIMLHLNGRASVWAKDSALGDLVDILGPKKEIKVPLDFNAKEVLLVSDLTGFSTMEYILSKLDPACRGDLFLICNTHIEVNNPTKVKIHFVSELDYDVILKKLKVDIHGHIILGSDQIKSFVQKIDRKFLDNINVKAYWKTK